MAEAREILEEELGKQKFTAKGFRLLGYNGPDVPRKEAVGSFGYSLRWLGAKKEKNLTMSVAEFGSFTAF